MTKYREILRLTSLGFTQRNIVASCGVSQKTIVKVQHRAKELYIPTTEIHLHDKTELLSRKVSHES